MQINDVDNTSISSRSSIIEDVETPRPQEETVDLIGCDEYRSLLVKIFLKVEIQEREIDWKTGLIAIKLQVANN